MSLSFYIHRKENTTMTTKNFKDYLKEWVPAQSDDKRELVRAISATLDPDTSGGDLMAVIGYLDRTKKRKP